MTTGRKPIPTQIKKMQGTLEKSRVNKAEPALPVSIPKIPAHEGRSPGIVGQFGVPPDDVKQHAANILDAMTRANAGGERPSVGR